MSSAKESSGTLAAMAALAVLSFSLGAIAASKAKASPPRTNEEKPETSPLDVDEGVTEAARATAKWMTVGLKRRYQGKAFMDACGASYPERKTATEHERAQAKKNWCDVKMQRIERMLESDPAVASFRPVGQSTHPLDGWTPLHYAAFAGRIEVVARLLKAGLSAWSVDLQGRTALSLATEKGHGAVSLLLKDEMERASGGTIVGPDAPVDLSGRTPLGCCDRRRLPDDVKQILYAKGDGSICPATPPTSRSSGQREIAICGGLVWGVSNAPGWSQFMQDEYCSHNPIDAGHPDVSMFGVFDGHGSSTFTSDFAARKLKDCLLRAASWTSGDMSPSKLKTALVEAFIECDALLATEPRMVVTLAREPMIGPDETPDAKEKFAADDTSGSTGVVAVITPTHVLVANAGDSRAILIQARMIAGASDNGAVKGKEADVDVTVIPMSNDHTANDADERERVNAAGGIAYFATHTDEQGNTFEGWRARYDATEEDQCVSPTRGFGDLFYKQKRIGGALRPADQQVVTVCPEVMAHKRGGSGGEGADEEFILLASDGLWDVFQNLDAGRFLISSLPNGVPFHEITGEHLAIACDALVHECLRRGSHDNLTALVVSTGKRASCAMSRTLFR